MVDKEPDRDDTVTSVESAAKTVTRARPNTAPHIDINIDETYTESEVRSEEDLPNEDVEQVKDDAHTEEVNDDVDDSVVKDVEEEIQEKDENDEEKLEDGVETDEELGTVEGDVGTENDDHTETEIDSISQAESEISQEGEAQLMTGESVQSVHSSIDVRIVKVKDLDADDSRPLPQSETTFITDMGQNEEPVTPAVDEVQAELDRVLSKQAAEEQLQPQELPGRLAALNTPATPMTVGSLYSESPTRSGTKQTLASLPSATKDTIYQRALALMSTRCSSHDVSFTDTGTTDKLPLIVTNLPDHPYRHFPDSYFYVTQQRPLPAAPVKAWRGYHGNVYFEPLQCKRLETAPSLSDKSYYSSISVKRRAARSVTFSPRKEILNQHQYRRETTKKPGTRQMAILDKTSVIQRMDENVQEDVRWISGMESVGSLRVGSVGSSSTRTNIDRYDKMKICRGFVNHATSPRSQTLPVVPLKGGGITHPVSKSKYLTSQYRGSSRQGLRNGSSAMNMSPELYGYPDTLPHLDKLQASLDNVERSREMVLNIPPYPGLPMEASTPRPKADATV